MDYIKGILTGICFSYIVFDIPAWVGLACGFIAIILALFPKIKELFTKSDVEQNNQK